MKMPVLSAKWKRCLTFGALLVVLTPSARSHASNLADIKARGELVMLCFPHSTRRFSAERRITPPSIPLPP